MPSSTATPFDLGQAVPDGLRFVHQDLGLVLELNAMDNLALHGGFARGRERPRAAGASRSRRPTACSRASASTSTSTARWPPQRRSSGPSSRSPRRCRAGTAASGVLVLDEPTAVLPHDEVERLFAMVREVRSAGTSVLYVSHRLDEIFELADRVTVLRGGRVVATHAVAEIDARGLASLMVGEDVDPDYRAPVAARPDAPVVLEARDVRGRWLRGVDLDVHRGEILGIAGLAGAGVLELPYVLAGLRAARRQRARSACRSGPTEWPDVADAGDLDIPLVPADRRREGDRRRVRRQREPLAVDPRTPRPPRHASTSARSASSSSGGRSASASSPPAPTRRSRRSAAATSRRSSSRAAWRASPTLLVLCEPTAGVDIGTRVAIYDLIAELSRSGLTVVVSSSDAGDLLAMCTRVVVLRDGQVAAELGGDGLTEHALVSAMEGEHR